MITVNFRNQTGEITTRRFAPGEGVSIYGSVSAANIPAPFSPVRIEASEVGYFDDTTTNFFGDYAFWFVAPNDNKTINLKITASLAAFGDDVVSIPIRIGTGSVPGRVETETKNSPWQALLDLFPSWDKIFLYGGALLLIVAAVYFLPVWLPRVKKALK